MRIVPITSSRRAALREHARAPSGPSERALIYGSRIAIAFIRSNGRMGSRTGRAISTLQITMSIGRDVSCVSTIRVRQASMPAISTVRFGAKATATTSSFHCACWTARSTRRRSPRRGRPTFATGTSRAYASWRRYSQSFLERYSAREALDAVLDAYLGPGVGQQILRGHILGAHLVGPHVDEMINVFALAIRHGLTADDLKSTIFAYPTGASDIGHMV